MVREAAASRSFQDIDHLLAQVKTSTGLDLGGTATPAAAFLDLSLRYWTWAATRMRGVPPNTIHDVLGGLIVHPLKELGIRYNPNSEAFRDYVTSMALALMLGIRADQPEED